MKKTFFRFFGKFAFLLALSATITGCMGPGAEKAAVVDGPITFVQISDTHHGKPIHQYRFRQAVDNINNLPFEVTVVAHTGDFASDQLYREDRAAAISNILAGIKYPLICAPGNHDLSYLGKEPEKRYADCLEMYRKYIGELGQVYETDEAVFIALYTECLRRDLPVIEGYDPLKWLESEIKKAGDKLIFVFTHTPDGTDFYNNKVHNGWPEENRRAWRKILASGNVKGVFCGHYHRDELQQNDDGIPVYVCSSIANFWGRQASFRIYHYENGKVSYRSVYIEDPPRDTVINPDGTIAETEPVAVAE